MPITSWRASRLLFCIALCLSGLLHAQPPALLLAQRWHPGDDPSPYWISEKFDGVRAYWDGRALRLRGGATIQAPVWFTAGFPATALDGELWAGHGGFERVSGIVRRETPHDEDWRTLRYLVFELPDQDGDFSTRLAHLRRLVGLAGVPWLQAVEHVRIRESAALDARLEAVLKAGGEGLMLHRADAPYTTGRSSALLKYTPWDDAEAQVIAHLPGTGRLSGRLGALWVEMPDGRRFRLGSGLNEAVRRTPPPPGSVITYRHRGFTRTGLPRHASFLRLRPEGL